MGRTILFSPLGGTDPISDKNNKDGALLHVCRIYKPDKIYIYMSAEIIEKHNLDNRYLYCLEKLYSDIGKPLDYELIERPDMLEVQEFNVFYKEFYDILKDIIKSKAEDDNLLVNISSGSPAMKSALLVIKTLGELDCTAIQVATPEKKMNNHSFDYDVVKLFDSDPDNAPDFEDRSCEVECPNLMHIKTEEIIIKLLRQYDYSGALNLCDVLPSDITKAYKWAIELAYYRNMVDIYRAKKLNKNKEPVFLPETDSKTLLIVEYALNLSIKLKQEKYVDYVRAITPLIVELYILILKKYTGFDVDEYVITNDDPETKLGEADGRIWSMDKLNSSENPFAKKIINIVSNKGNAEDKGRYFFVYSADLIRVIKDNKQLFPSEVITKCNEIREVESNIRNIAAHQLKPITPNNFTRFTSGRSPGEIMNIIKDMLKYTDISEELIDWDSYDKMNEHIIATIKSK